MAETAAILNPDKTILLPDRNSGCGLADMATVEQLRKKKMHHPDAVVVSYVNSTAEVKAESDFCCTSANAVDIVQSIPENTILFIPDRNLGSYVAEQTGKNIILWNGYCYVHENIAIDQLALLKRNHPYAEIIVHPECSCPVRHVADFVGGTADMSRYVAQSAIREFIVGTETNFTYRLQKDNPHKSFYPVHSLCEGMNLITLEKIRLSLERLEFIIEVPEEIRKNAKNALDNMFMIKTRHYGFHD